MVQQLMCVPRSILILLLLNSNNIFGYNIKSHGEESLPRIVRRSAQSDSDFDTGNLLQSDVQLNRIKLLGEKHEISKNITGYFSIENGDLSFLEEEIAKGSTQVSLYNSPKKSSCIIWSGSHLRTFDGITFTLRLTNHILMQTNNVNGFKLWMNEDDQLSFTEKSSIEEPFVLTFNRNTNEPILRQGNETHPIPGVINGMILEHVGDKIVFINIPGIGIKIKWNTNDQFIIEANENLWNKTLSGICGNFDGNPLTDFQLQDGNIATKVDELFDSWSLDGMSPRFGSGGFIANPCSTAAENNDKAIQFCGKILTSPQLERCHHVINGYSFYQTCRWDYCAGNIDRACQSVELFVSWCQDYGSIDFSEGWRSPDFCPFECDVGLEYSICGSGDSLSCEDAANIKQEEFKPTVPPTNIVTYSGFPSDNEYCIEGCYCPKGMFMHNGQCIQRKECPCTFNGIEFPSGKTIYQECNQCQCEAGNWLCSEKLCGRSCSYYGHNHITTFDGKDFSFRSLGSFLLVKDEDISVSVNTCKNPQSISSSSSTYLQDNYHVSFITIKAFGQEILLNDNFQLSFNGAFIPELPYTFTTSNGNIIFITKDTSLFIGLSFSNGFNIKWNGHSRIYVHVPPSAFGQVKGLCGNYNKIQRDDFVTPEGEIESVNEAFVLSWQTKSCQKSSTKPDSLSRLTSCSLSSEKKKEYSNYCALLKTSIFEKCHWAVDPDAFYKDCLVDICHCNDQNEAFNCLCPILSHYAQVCSSKGIYLESWRQSVKPCSISCSSGQKFSVCHKDCYRTCSDVTRRNKTCESNHICVEGCACPEGQVLNDQNICVLISQCPCTHFLTGDNVNAGEVRYNAKARGKEHCTCKNGIWNCRELKNEEERKMKKSLVTCDKKDNLVYKECVSLDKPQATCKNLDKNIPVSNSTSCDFGGCVCKEGFILLTKDSKSCIPEKKCPCHHGGKSYEEGNRIKQDCNTCICNSGKWTCTKRVCPAICTAWGDSHYISFDGKMFDFKGKCEYVMAQYKGSSKDSFSILIQNIPCGTSNVTCSKRITIKIGSKQFQEKIILNQNLEDLSNDFHKRINIRKAGLFTFVDVYDLGFTIQWDGSNRVYLKIKPFLKGLVQGLCGNANEDEEDDFRGPSGITETFPTTFGDSWRVHKYCPVATEVEDECELNPERRTWSTNKCSVLHSEVFEPCHSEIDWEPWYKKCLSDACGCNVGGDCECLCTAISAYAHECTRAGVPISWRKQNLCPMQCPHHSSYESCVNTCPVKTCKALIVEKASSLSCADEYCVEGCRPDSCPKEHLVYLSDNDYTCIDPDQCEKPKCIVENNKLFYEGDVMESDECHNCTCSRGQKLCYYSSLPECESDYLGTTIFPKLDLSTSSPITIINNTNLTYLSCNHGWSNWMNTNTPTILEPNDVEDIHKFLNNSYDVSQGYCSPYHIVDIECRAVGSSGPAYSTNDYTIECDTKKGLTCQVNNPEYSTSLCDDFEYRINCECVSSEIKGTVDVETCDPDTPPLLIKEQCNLYKECVQDSSDPLPKFQIKSCDNGLFYNPRDITCDWPDNVIHIRSDCQVGEPSPSASSNTTICDSFPYEQNVAHETDCSLFYHCFEDNQKLQYESNQATIHRKAELKSCGHNSIFNTETHICDSPYNVYPHRPECKTRDTPIPTQSYSTTSSIIPLITDILEDKTACLKNNTHSLLDNSEGNINIKVSSVDPDSDISNVKIEPEENFVVKSLEAVQEGNSEERPSESLFSIDLCNSKECCSIEKLTNADKLEGEELHECKNFDLGSTDPHIKLTHLDDSLGVLNQIKLTDNKNNVVFCNVQEVFDGKVTRDYSCEDTNDEKKDSILDKIVLKHSEEPSDQSSSYRPEEYTIKICDNGNCCELEYIHDLANQKETLDTSNEECKNIKLNEVAPEIKVEYNGPGINTLEDVELISKNEPIYKCDVKNYLTNNDQQSFACTPTEKAPKGTDDCWKPHENDGTPYVEFKFDENKGVRNKTQGGKGDEFVTSYNVLIGDSEDSLSYIEDNYGIKKVFKGNSNGLKPQTSFLNPAVPAQVVRIIPLSWNKEICLKVDLIGCGDIEEEDIIATSKPYIPVQVTNIPKTPKQDCIDEMGITNGNLSTKQILVSSVKNGDQYSYGKERLRLSNGGSWQPEKNDRQPFVTIDFGDERLVSGVILKGDSRKFIKSFRVVYSNDNHKWENIRDEQGKEFIFHGNYDDQTISERQFKQVIRMRYFKLIPVSWARLGAALKLELIGCFKPFIIGKDSSIFTTPLPTPGISIGKTTKSGKCADPCPNLPNYGYSSECHICLDHQKWNGTDCVHESQCECYDGFIKHKAGDIFLNQDCESCFCLKNGTVHCSPKTCPKCYGENEFSYITPRCACICKTCTKEERYCKTSKVCIKAEKWCDGVTDCADDETDCSEDNIGSKYDKTTTTKSQYERTTTTESQYDRPTTTDSSPISYCPPEPQCPSGARLRQTEIESPIGCPLSKCECLEPVCADGLLIQFEENNTNSFEKSSKPMKFEFQDSYGAQPFYSSDNKENEDLNIHETLICPKFKCIPPPTKAECIVDGPNVLTFDKSKYKLSSCHFVLAANEHDSWNISVVKTCKIGCQKSLIIKHGEESITLNLDFSIDYHDVHYAASQVSKMSDFQDIKIRILGDSNIIFESKKYPLRVSWSKFGKVEVRTDSTNHNKVVGLCGKFNGKSDDLMKSNGQVTENVEEFIESWETGDQSCMKTECPLDRQRRALELCRTFKYPPFNNCKDVLDMKSVTEHCVEDTCTCLEKSDDDIRTCRCEAQTKFVNQCLQVDRNLDLSRWRVDHFCPAKCPEGKVMRDCYDPSCQTKCGDKEEKCSRDSEAICFSGCFCSDDEVLSSDGITCIPKKSCKDCVCEGSGHSQFKNFDDIKYEVPGNCSYVAVRHDHGDFEIQIENEQCPDDIHSSCVKAVIVNTADNSLRIEKDPKSKEGVSMYERNNLIKTVHHITDWYKSRLSAAGNVFLTLFKFDIEIVYKIQNSGFTVKYASYSHGSQTDGLCGNCNQNPDDDFAKRDKSPSEDMDDFISSWTSKSCSSANIIDLPDVETCINEDNDQCEKLRGETFVACHPIIPVDQYVNHCKKSFCKRENYTTCKAFEEYSETCFEKGGLCISWREKEHCQRSLTCPLGLEYKECANDACEKTCEDVISSLVDISYNAQKTFGNDGCDMGEPEGCYCPEGKVFNKERKCVSENLCHTCKEANGTEYHLTEEWHPSSCETCSCTELGISCVIDKCVKLPCPVGQKVIEHYTEGECCPKQTCVPATKNCTFTKPPECESDYQVKEIQLDNADCPTYVCECIPREQCPELEPEEELEPGEKSTMKDTGCCLHRKKVCDPKACPEPPICPTFHELKKIDEKCCPNYICESPNACIDDFHGNLHQIGESWKEGHCKNCTCVQANMGVKPVTTCSVESCPSLSLEDENYLYKKVNVDKECCPISQPIVCLHQGEKMKPGELKKELKGDSCKIYECQNTLLGGVKKSLELVEKCNTECPRGSNYTTSVSDQCCGKCVPYACSAGNQTYEVGKDYVDGCFTRKCYKDHEELILSEKTKDCPNIEDCPAKFLIDDEYNCCKICNQTMEKGSCEEITFDPKKTIGLVKEFDLIKGTCKNLNSIPEYRQCSGYCESKTVYLSPLESHSSDCKCCQTLKQKAIDVTLTCENGQAYTKTINVPENCGCTQCGAKAEFSHIANSNSNYEEINDDVDVISFDENMDNYNENAYVYQNNPESNEAYDAISAFKNLKNLPLTTNYTQANPGVNPKYESNNEHIFGNDN
ncbi:LOW QUALITY PROTEIN: hemocytin-like [Lepeophtheirus salmonis]|uniref:LOW QUALITY PROTEIN: hemocytin-like n=1 Tax=Lepeophtheirus salmonis TaxID=72036 RepID=UPI003AF333B4